MNILLALLATTPLLPRHASDAKEKYEAEVDVARYSIPAYLTYKQHCFQTQDYDALVRVSVILIERFPGEPEPYFGYAEGRFFAGNKADGLAMLDRLLKRDPETTLRIGSTLERFRFYREAIDRYLRYRRLKKNDAYLTEELIRAYQFAEDFRGAAVELVRLVDRNPGTAAAHEYALAALVRYTAPKTVVEEVKKIKSEKDRARLLARLYIEAKDFRAASREFKKTGSKNELAEFARLCVDAGAFEPALEIYRKLRLPVEQAGCLRRLDRPVEAASVLAGDRTLPGRLLLADLYRTDLREPTRAAALYRSILSDQPGYPPAEKGLADALIRSGELAPAQAFLAEVRTPADWVLADKIKIAFFEGKFDSIPDHALQLSRSFPESPYLNDAFELAFLSKETDSGLADFGRALFAYESGRCDDGIRILKNIINRGTGLSDDCYVLLARCFRAKKDAGSALAALDEMAKKYPESPALARNRLEAGLIYEQDLRDFKAAKKTLEDLIISHPDSPQAVVARNVLALSNQNIR